MKGYVAHKGDRWYAVIYQGVDPETGRERRSWIPAGTDRSEAEALAAQLGREERERRNGHRSELTFAGFIHRYWLPTKELRLEPSTFDGYRRHVRLHLLPHLGDTPLRRINIDQIQTLYRHLLKEGNTLTGNGLAAKTVLDIHIILRSALANAVKRGLLRDNPAVAAEAPSARRPTNRAHRIWTAKQLTSFLRTTVDTRYHPAFWLAANTGMRRSEILGTRWNQLDPDTQRLSVSRTVVAVDYQIHESPGKTRNSRRSIDLDTRTVEVLLEWQQHQAEELGSHDPGGPIFTKKAGPVLHPHALSQAFERAVAKTTLPKITIHDLRHTHATLLIKAGVPLKVVSERLGHSSPAFTMATYQHVIPGMQADAANTFAALLKEHDNNDDGTGEVSSTGFYPVEESVEEPPVMPETRSESSLTRASS